RRHTSSTRDWSSDVCSSDLFAFLSAPGSLAAVYPWCLGTFRTLDAGKFIGQNSLGFNLFIGSAAAVLAMAGAFLFAPTDRLSARDRKSTRLNSSHEWISYAV